MTLGLRYAPYGPVPAAAGLRGHTIVATARILERARTFERTRGQLLFGLFTGHFPHFLLIAESAVPDRHQQHTRAGRKHGQTCHVVGRDGLLELGHGDCRREDDRCAIGIRKQNAGMHYNYFMYPVRWA